MPKKTSAKDHSAWLRRFESGESESAIADDLKKDLRTVKGGIAQARNQQDARAARARLVADALREHQNDLMIVVGAMQSAVQQVLPGSLIESLPLGLGAMPVRLQFNWFRMVYDSKKAWLIEFDAEGGPQWPLAREHLQRDPAWRAVNAWKNDTAVWLVDWLAVVRALVTTLKEDSKLDVVDSRKKDARTEYVYYQGIRLLCRLALGPESSEVAYHPDAWDQSLSVKNDEIVYQAQPGSETITVALGDEKTREKLIKAVRRLAKLPQSAKAIDSRSRLLQSAMKAHRLLEEISMVRIVPGDCRVCRRLGL